MANGENGSFLNGAADRRRSQRLDEADRRTAALGETEARLADEQARFETIAGALDTTAGEIDNLITAAEQAQAAGAAPEQVGSIRRLIELMGAQLGVETPGVPQPEGSRPVPGSEALIRSGLNRFDAMFGGGADGQGADQTAVQPQATLDQLGVAPEAVATLRGLSQKLQQGFPLTGDETVAYSQAFGEVTRPRVLGQDVATQRAVQPVLDETLFPRPEDIGARPADTQRPAALQPAAGQRVAQAQGALTANALVQGAQVARGVRNAIVNRDGSINRTAAFSFARDIPLIRPGQEAQIEETTLRTQIRDDLARKLERETGARPNRIELDEVTSRFIPTLFDTDAEVRERLDRMVGFLGGSLRKTDPELFGTLIERAREEGNVPDPPKDDPEAEFRGFDPASGVAIFKRTNGTFFGAPRRG